MTADGKNRIVLTLDAGGTNFVFSAIRNNEEIITPVELPSRANDLERCLDTIREGFSRCMEAVPAAPAAISFAFPGPADYPAGIIGDLVNLPAFRGGVALGPMLEAAFGLPVFINNDGDLFAYGEAIAGFLPKVNGWLEKAGSPKRYRNLFGITLGTGFGAGIVCNGELYIGDNSAGAEIWGIRTRVDPSTSVEEYASIRGVRRCYAEKAGISLEACPNPREIYEIAIGSREGDGKAARYAFFTISAAAGDALANAITLMDTLVVVGGGLAGAHELILPEIVREMNAPLRTPDGGSLPRMESRAYNLEDAQERNAFLHTEKKRIRVPGTGREIDFDPVKRTGVGLSVLGTSKAVSIGAYAFALHELDKPSSRPAE